MTAPDPSRLTFALWAAGFALLAIAAWIGVYYVPHIGFVLGAIGLSGYALCFAGMAAARDAR